MLKFLKYLWNAIIKAKNQINKKRESVVHKHTLKRFNEFQRGHNRLKKEIRRCEKKREREGRKGEKDE